MILIVEPNIKEIKIWGYKENAGRLAASVCIEDIEDVKDGQALKKALRGMVKNDKIEAVSFRIIFGGDYFKEPALISEDFFEKFKRLVPFMPFYVPVTCETVRLFFETLKGVPMYAFFETSFFHNLPDDERYYAIPMEYFQKTGMKRYGFHGMYHESNCDDEDRAGKIVSVVLDKQTTVCAIKQNRPLTVSLGYTPLEGVMGRTSCGDLDPGIVFYLMKRYKYSIFEIDDILKRQSGFLGLTGYDLTIKEFAGLYGADKKVTFAFDVYKNQILKYIGEAISCMDGLDTVVFAGEYLGALMPVVYNIMKRIAFLGVTLKELPWAADKERFCITPENSKVQACLNLAPLPKILFNKTKALL